MNAWVKANLSVLISIMTIIVLMTLQWAGFQQTAKLAAETERRLRLHEQDVGRHVDPQRDELRWRDLLRRLDRIEDKLDRR
jgi:hypothetical protein